MAKNKCLIIADDLTGGADTGAKFAERGLDTLLVSTGDDATGPDLRAHGDRDVLVVNTDTRGIGPEEAFERVSKVLAAIDPAHFPVIYKKIDSTLRGNLGREIDALLAGARKRLAFLAPSFPEQGRVVVGGMLLVGGKPLALAEVPQDRDGDRKSHVRHVLEEQTWTPSVVVGLEVVAAGGDTLCEGIREASAAGGRILVFDAVRRGDLAQVAAAAFHASPRDLPLFVGSAGLAEEVAKVLAKPRGEERAASLREPIRPVSRVLMVCGSKSRVTRAQVEHIEKLGQVRSLELPAHFIDVEDGPDVEEARRFALKVASALTGGHVLLKACSTMMDGDGVSEKITRCLAAVARRGLDAWRGAPGELALVLTGGATASAVLSALDTEGIEITGEIVGGIARGILVGGPWDSVTVVTKAGGFGTMDCFERILTTLDCGVASRTLP